jgi:hypothetical protein
MLAARALLGQALDVPWHYERRRPFNSSQPTAAEASSSGSGSSSSGAAAAGQAAAPAGGASLSKTQQDALASLVLSSFKRDAATAANVLNKSLDDSGKKELLTALGANLATGVPELSRWVG